MNKTVSKLPLEKLTGPAADLEKAHCLKALNQQDIVALLKRGPLWFVIAELGQELKWRKPEECFQFWKQEVKSHLADPDEKMSLDSYPENYAYFARQWETSLPEAVIVLEKHH